MPKLSVAEVVRAILDDPFSIDDFCREVALSPYFVELMVLFQQHCPEKKFDAAMAQYVTVEEIDVLDYLKSTHPDEIEDLLQQMITSDGIKMATYALKLVVESHFENSETARQRRSIIEYILKKIPSQFSCFLLETVEAVDEMIEHLDTEKKEKRRCCSGAIYG